MFEAIAKSAARRYILVMMACHRLDRDKWPGNGLWCFTDLLPILHRSAQPTLNL